MLLQMHFEIMLCGCECSPCLSRGSRKGRGGAAGRDAGLEVDTPRGAEKGDGLQSKQLPGARTASPCEFLRSRVTGGTSWAPGSGSDRACTCVATSVHVSCQRDDKRDPTYRTPPSPGAPGPSPGPPPQSAGGKTHVCRAGTHRISGLTEARSAPLSPPACPLITSSLGRQ